MKLKNLVVSVSSGLVLGMLNPQVSANPTGAEVVTGQVTFSQPNLNTLQINNSNGSIINWQNFSIKANELTHFQQSGANSVVLNQVVGSNVSNIFGSLTSNGQVYLINPYGVVFGENSVVNTAGFIASTLNLSNQDFLDGKLNFEGVDAADILNKGFITAGADGDIALIAPNIINEGVIKVEQGDVILAAGEKVTLTSLSASDVGFEVQSENNSITNLGSITTDGGAVGMFAGSLMHSGAIHANALSLDKDGNVILVAKNNLEITADAVISADGEYGGRVVIKSETGTTLVAGDVSAKGENGTGGVIDVLGDQVGVIDSATINASGNLGGGQVHIGGNLQGKGELQNATATYVGTETSINANAINSGDGGEVIVWADETARVHGSISATGGSQGGNGGFVETSGKQYLDVSEIKLDLSADNGNTGEWLLDPYNLTISTGGDATVGAAPDFSAGASLSNLSTATLITQLNNGASVTINTGGAGAENGDITLFDNLDLTSVAGSSLTLDAANDIILNGSINDTGVGLPIVFTADSGVPSVVENNNVGEIFVNNFINTSGGDVVLNAGSGITFSINGTINTGNANLTAVTSTGSIDFVQTGLTAIDAGTGVVSLTADQIFDSSLADLDVIANALILQTVNGAGFFGAELDTQVNSLNFNNTGATGAVAVINNSAADLTVTGTNLSNDSSAIIRIEENTGGLNINNITGGNNGDLIFNAGNGDITLLPAQSILAGTNFGSINLSSGGTINLGAGSLIKTQSGTSDIFLDAFDIVFPTATIDAGGAKVFFNQVNTAGIGIGNASGTTGLEVDDTELTNIFAGLVMFGSTTAGQIDISANIDMSLLGYDLFLASAVGLNFQAGSGVNVSGGKLSLYAPSFDFSSIDQQILGTGVIEFVNLLDSPSIELNIDCVSQTGAVCVSQANLNNLADGFSSIRFATASAGSGGIEVTSVMTFKDNAEFDTSIANGDINLATGLDLTGNDILMNAGAGAINFNNPTVIEITNANNVDLAASIISSAAGTTNISANRLNFLTDNGFGTAAIPFMLAINELAYGENTNSSNEMYLFNSQDLLLTYLKQGTGAGLSTTTVNVAGNLTVGQVDGGGNTVILDTTVITNGVGGTILDDTFSSPNVINAYRADIHSEMGVGTATDWFEVANIDDGNLGGGLFTSAVTSGDIFIDNIGGTGPAFNIQSVITNATGNVFIHNWAQPMNLNVGITTTGGDITLESNSDINMFASINAGGAFDANVLVVGGAGDINLNGGNVFSNTGAANLSTINGDIFFGSTNYVTGSVVNLSTSNGLIDGSLSPNAIGGGSTVNQLNVSAFGNIDLSGASNDADFINLNSTNGNITFSDINDIGLNNIVAAGTVAITAAGAITDNNGGLVNVTSNIVQLFAANGIGEFDAIETDVNWLQFNNSTAGSVEIFDQSATLQVSGVNNSNVITDATRIESFGDLSVLAGNNVSAPNSDVFLTANKIILTGSVSTAATAAVVVLTTDELDISAGGALISSNGDVSIESLTDGLDIYLASVVDNVGALDISAAEISSITANRLSIGAQDFPAAGLGSNNIVFNGAINTGTMDTRFVTMGDIIFNQGAATAVTNTAVNGVELNARGVISDQSTGMDVSSTNVSLIANNGIGNGNALDVTGGVLNISNLLSGNVDVSVTGSSTLAPFTMSHAGNFSLTGSTDLFINDITLAGGITFLQSGGQLLGNGAAPTISNSSQVVLDAVTGIGTAGGHILLDGIGVGGVDITLASGNAYVDSFNTSAAEFIVGNVTINNGSAIINNFDVNTDTRVSGAITGNGTAQIISLPTMWVDGSFNMATTGGVDLQVTGTGGSLFINDANIISATGNISLLADLDVSLTGTTNLQTSLPGLISLSAINGEVLTDDTTSITGGGNLNVVANTGILLAGNNDIDVLGLTTTTGNILFKDINDIVLGVINAATDSGSVTLNTQGAIIDGNGVATNITAQTISLNAANGIGTNLDPIELAAQTYFNFSNSTAGDVVVINSVANSVLLSGVNLGGHVNISYDNTMQLLDVSAAGNMILTSINGSIIDSNDTASPVLNLSADNIDLTAFNSIGDGNAIETQLTGTIGTININNTSATLGNFEIENWAINAFDVVTFTANNVALNGNVILLNPLGVMNAGAISSNQSFIELKALDLNLVGAVNNNDAAGTNAILLVADDVSLSGGTLNANNGGVDIFTLSNGRGITLGATDAASTTLDLVQADADAIIAARLSIGLMDTVNSIGTGDITIAGPLDVGVKDINAQTLSNIVFTNGAVDGLSTTGNMNLNAELAVIGDNATGINLTANSLSIKANFGIGSTNAIRTKVTDLTVFNQFSNNLNIANSGALIVSDSANLAGAMSLSSDNSLTLTPSIGLAGTTGAVAQTDLTLKAETGLFINGVASATNINLISAEAIAINEVVTATNKLVINADSDGNNTGDLLIENINGGVLDVSAANIVINGASVSLQATNGAVHVNSKGGLNLTAANDVNIVGGTIAGADAYLSAVGNIDMGIGGNVALAGGSAANTAASIFDVSGANKNTLNMTVDGSLSLTAGSGDSSGTYIRAGEVNLKVAGDMSLTGSAANLSPAQVRGSALNMSLIVGGGLSFIDGTGTDSLAQVISNDGLGYMSVSYAACTGCANGLLFLDQPIINTATNEIVSTQNDSVITTEAAVSSSDALVALLDESNEPNSETEAVLLGDETTSSTDGTATTTTEEEDKLAEQEAEPEPKTLVCR